MSKPWTKEDVLWLTKNYKNKTTEEKAIFLSRGKNAILAKQQSLGLTRNKIKLNIGDVINYWTLKKEFIKNGSTYYTCVCKCGNIKDVSRQSLIEKTSKSCGCFMIEIKTKHGLSYNKIYKTWQSIKERCYNKNNIEYKNYGARGITIAEIWKNDPKLFCDYISNTLGIRPNKCSLDRINNNGNYEPGNLRWANQKTQIRNSRSSKLTETDVAKIKKELNNKGLKKIARQFNVSVGAINAIKRGDNWKDVK